MTKSAAVTLLVMLMAIAISSCGGGGSQASAPISQLPPPPPPPPPPIQGPFTNAMTQSIVSDYIVGSIQKIQDQNIVIVRELWRDTFDTDIAEDRLIAYEQQAESYRRIDHVVIDSLQSHLASRDLSVFYVVSDWRKLKVFHVDQDISNISMSQEIDLIDLLNWTTDIMPAQAMVLSPDGRYLFLMRHDEIAVFLVDLLGHLTYQATYPIDFTTSLSGDGASIHQARIAEAGDELFLVTRRGVIKIMHIAVDGSLTPTYESALEGFNPDLTIGYDYIDSFVTFGNGKVIIAVGDSNAGGFTMPAVFTWLWNGTGYTLVEALDLPEYDGWIPSINIAPTGDVMLLGRTRGPQLGSTARATIGVTIFLKVDAEGAIADKNLQSCLGFNISASYREGYYDTELQSFYGTGPSLMRFNVIPEGVANCVFVQLEPKTISMPGKIYSVAISNDGQLATVLTNVPAVHVFKKGETEFVHHQTFDMTHLIPPGKLTSIDISPDKQHVYVHGNLDLLLLNIDADGIVSHSWSMHDPDDRGLAGQLHFAANGQVVITAGKRLDQYIDHYEIIPTVNTFSRDVISGSLTPLHTITFPEAQVNDLRATQAFYTALSPDEKNLYLAIRTDDPRSLGLLFVLDVTQPDSVKLVSTLVDAVLVPGTPLSDEVIDGLRQASGVVVSPDGTQVFVTGHYTDGANLFTGFSSDTAMIAFERDPGTGALSVFRYFKNDDADSEGEPSDMKGGYFLPRFTPDGKNLVTIRADYLYSQKSTYGIDVFDFDRNSQKYGFVEHVSIGGFGRGITYYRAAEDVNRILGVNLGSNSLEFADLISAE